MIRQAAIALMLAALPAPLLAAPALSPADTAREDAGIRQVIADMQAAWNRGDYRGYMAGFQNPGVIFVSGGKFQDGWQGTLDHYIRDYGDSVDTRGTLTFSDIRIEFLAPDAAQLISRYHLERPQKAMSGINTRLMRKIDGRWLIALNHVSAYDVPPAGK
ncbi:nuclear transport factor 2 family protein [Caulobacter segnis]|uniref:YybH family protein n=1 Tax=Caulobacter segnis TaxID=88688 RepID=UPI0024107D2E|nr:nuclear transport factor 2 family protein [Caulobacter segnis]MDG2522038.1 nuclear transport factor 2 family protein [Caulobacter segnis]